MNAALMDSGVVATVGQERCAWANGKSLGRSSIMGQKMMSSGFFLWCDVEQVMDVRDAHLGGEAGVDGAALGPFFVQAFVREVGIDEVLRGIPSASK